MASCIRAGGRLLRTQALRMRPFETPQPLRQYASSSKVKQQATAAAAGAMTGKSSSEGGCPMMNANITSPRPVTEVPGPMRLPFFGSFVSMIFDKDFKRLNLNLYWRKLKEKYGDVVRLDFPGWGPMVIIYHPDDCQTLTRVTMKNPVRRGANTIIKIREDAIDNYFDKKPGLIASNDDEWWRVRSGVQTPMMKPKNVTAYMTQMDEVAIDFLDRIAVFQKDLGEMPSNFQTELYKWSFESVCLVALNRRMGCLDFNLPDDSEPMTLIREANNIFEGLNYTEIGPQLWRFFPTPAYLKVKRSHNKFLRVADQNIRKTEAQLLAKDPNSDDELSLMETLLMTPNLTRKDVVTLILDMMLAGIDTTSHTVAFTLYLLAKYPRVQAKLQEEIDTVLQGHEGPLKPKHLGQLSYLKAVVKESLRIFPLGQGTIRTLQEDAVFGGYLIPKGFTVGSWNMFMAEDERTFQKAKEFIPERWSRDRPMGPIHPHASQPFGIGTRMCVGRRIAEQEIYIFLTRVMQRFNVDYKYKDMGIVTKLISVPSEPLRFNFTERR